MGESLLQLGKSLRRRQVSRRTILVTGAELPASMGLVRCLGQAGHRVILAGCVWWSTARASRYVSRYVRLPSPRFSYGEFCESVERLIREENVDLVIPCFEEVFYLARAMRGLGVQSILFADRPEVLEALHDKYAFMELLKKHGMRHPVSHRFAEKDTLHRMAADGGDWVLKPVHSRFSQDIYLAPTPKEIDALNVDASTPWVLQQRLSGTQVCTYSVAHHGKLTAHAAYTSLLSRGAGAGVACESVEDPATLAWVREFVSKLGFHGQVSFDFIEGEDGLPYPIECNPRATTGAFFVSYLPKGAAAFFETENALVQPKDSRKIINRLVGTTMGLEVRGDKAERKRIRAITKACNDYYFSYRDPMPVVWRVVCALGVVREAKRRGMDIETVTTEASVYDGQAPEHIDSD